MTWRLIMFDFDGVLCDSRALAIEYVEELRLVRKFAGLPSPRTVGHFGELYRGELRHALQRFSIPDEDAREFFAAHALSMGNRTDDLRLFMGVMEGLNSLPSGKFAIVTSAYSSAVRTILAHGGVDIEGIDIIGHEVRETKTEKAQKLLASRNLETAEAIYVGDMESDMAYCNAFGLRCIGVTYGYHPRSIIESAGPFAIVDSPQELFTLLEGELVA